jgi:hypothetical protein
MYIDAHQYTLMKYNMWFEKIVQRERESEIAL